MCSIKIEIFLCPFMQLPQAYHLNITMIFVVLICSETHRKLVMAHIFKAEISLIFCLWEMHDSLPVDSSLLY